MCAQAIALDGSVWFWGLATFLLDDVFCTVAITNPKTERNPLDLQGKTWQAATVQCTIEHGHTNPDRRGWQIYKCRLLLTNEHRGEERNFTGYHINLEKPDSTLLAEGGWQPPEPDAIQLTGQRHFTITAETEYKGPMVINIWDEYDPAVAPAITPTVATPAMTQAPTPSAPPTPTPTQAPAPGPEHYMAEGIKLHEEGKHHEALNHFREPRILLGTDTSELKLWEGRAHRALGHLETAIRHLDIAVYMDDNAINLAERGSIHAEMGNKGEALEDGYAARNSPDQTDGWRHSKAEANLVIARRWALIGRWEDSLYHAEEALRVATEHRYPENRTKVIRTVLEEAERQLGG